MRNVSEFSMSQVVQLIEGCYPFRAGEIAIVTEIRPEGNGFIYRLQGVMREQTGWVRGKYLTKKINRAVAE